MSDRLLPQRWVDPAPGSDPVHPYPDTIPVEGSDSVLKVALEFTGLIRRNLLLVLAFVAVSFGILAAMLYRERPEFRASAVIRLVDKTRAISGDMGTSATDQLGGSITDPILSQLQVLQSRGVAEAIVTREGLRLETLTRGFGWQYLDSIIVDDAAPFDTVRAQFGDSTFVLARAGVSAQARYGQPVALGALRLVVNRRPPVEQADFAVVPLQTAIDQVLAQLKGRARERTDVVDVTFQGTDPARAQRTVNAAVEAFQSASAGAARQESVRRRQFIEQQLDKTNAMLSEAQLQHNAFRSREQVYSSQDKFKSQQSDVTEIEMRRQELAADRQMYGSLIAALDSFPPGAAHDERLNALVSSPGIAASPVVAQQFGELIKLRGTRDSLVSGPYAAAATNPEVRKLDALIATAQADVISAVRGQISSVDARLAALAELKNSSSAEFSTLPTTEAKETDLLTQVQTYEHQAEALREELQKAQIEEAAEAGDVEIIDRATMPTKAIGTGRPPKIVFALVLGLVLGSIAAYILENYSAVIRKRDDLDRAVAMPNLAVIPRIKSLSGRAPKEAVATAGNGASNGNLARARGGRPMQRELVIVNDSRSSGAEAYRTLRTNLLFSAAVSDLKCLVVTSAGPKEGKSTTAANLAIAFAQQGHRVLLIDCDLRRPRIHKMFGQRQEPGLTEVLVGRASLEQAAQQTAVPNLLTLTSGVLPPNPVELLGSVKMRELLATLPATDLVVIDTPPLLAASDAAVLGRIADGVIMVVRAGRTQRGAVQESVQHLINVGARIVGTVLNDPDAEVAKYAPYYQYYYNSYYDYSTPER